MKNFVLLAVAILVVGVAGWVYYVGSSMTGLPGDNTGNEEGVVCTADAMQCPDGSWVGRTGPDCKFVCPGVDEGGSTGDAGILPYNSGVRGTVMVGPTCPVESYPPDPACADKPAKIFVYVLRGSELGDTVASLVTGPDGMFEFSLPPGEYRVMAGELGPPTCTAQKVTVTPGVYENITLSCDSGIR